MSPFKSITGRALGKLLEGYRSSDIGKGFGSGGDAVAGPYTITGGHTFGSGVYKYHVFTGPGSLILNEGSEITIKDLLVVGGGGGGGGGFYGGGGGGGGVIHVEDWVVKADTYSIGTIVFNVEVGDRGVAQSSTTNGTSGGDSVVSYFPGVVGEKTWRAIGGGGGGGRNQHALQGGSGGGTGYPKSGTAGTDNASTYGNQKTSPLTHVGYPGTAGVAESDYTFTNYGNPGGHPEYGSGGGGSHNDPNYGNGVPGPTTSANNPKGPNYRGGGDAQPFDAFTSTTLAPNVPAIPTAKWNAVSSNGLYGAGAGGGAYPSPRAYAGGNGGGGNGGNGSGNGSAGFGIGSGGGGSYPSTGVGADGTAGIVILRYRDD